MPAKTAKKKKPMPSKAPAKKTAVKKSSSSSPVRVSREPEPFYNDPKNLMVIGAVIVLFLVVVMWISGGGMTY